MTKFEQKASVLTPEELAHIGQLLHGDQWQSALARDLKMSLRNVQYMAAGGRPIHKGIVIDLVELLKPRAVDLASAINGLVKKLAS